MKHPKPPTVFLAATEGDGPSANAIYRADIYPGKIKMKLMAGTFVLDVEHMRKLVQMHDCCMDPLLGLLHFSRGEFDVAPGKRGKVVTLGKRKRA